MCFHCSVDGIAVSVFVVVLVEFDKYLACSLQWPVGIKSWMGKVSEKNGRKKQFGEMF